MNEKSYEDGRMINYTVNEAVSTLVDGWNPDSEELDEFVDDLIGDDVPEPFDSKEEATEFILGVGEYQDRNSFIYNWRDAFEMKGEGYFQDQDCHLCLEEGSDDPGLLVSSNDVQKSSFRPGYEKSRKDNWYRCKKHGDAHIVQSQTSYSKSD